MGPDKIGSRVLERVPFTVGPRTIYGDHSDTSQVLLERATNL